LSRVLKLHNIKLIRLCVYIVELEYYLHISVKYEKLFNIKYNKNKQTCTLRKKGHKKLQNDIIVIEYFPG